MIFTRPKGEPIKQTHWLRKKHTSQAQAKGGLIYPLKVPIAPSSTAVLKSSRQWQLKVLKIK